MLFRSHVQREVNYYILFIKGKENSEANQHKFASKIEATE